MSTNNKLADPCLVLWQAMNEAEKVGNRTDDKLIVKFLREAGYGIAPIAAHDAEQALPRKERPDFIAGYYAGLADGRRCAERDSAEQAAKAVPALYVGLIERLMRLSTRLGIAYEGGVEHFAASLEDRLYAICRGAESLLNSVATPPAPEAPEAPEAQQALASDWSWTTVRMELEASGRDDLSAWVASQLSTQAQQAAGQELASLPYPQLDSIPAFTEPGYTADQMRAYARAALAQRMERLTDGQLSALLKEARKIIRASSSRSLAKDWDRRATQALAGATTGKEPAQGKPLASPYRTCHNGKAGAVLAST